MFLANYHKCADSTRSTEILPPELRLKILSGTCSLHFMLPVCWFCLVSPLVVLLKFTQVIPVMNFGPVVKSEDSSIIS